MKYKVPYAGSTRKKGKCLMIKMFVTGALISKGFNGADAVKFSENTENPFVRFRIGVRVYDKRAENNHRFVNLNVKAFSYLTGRIKDMKLDAGMYVNIIGRYDDDLWEDPTTHEKKNTPVLIVDEIEFCHNGVNGKQNDNQNGAGASPSSPVKAEQTSPYVGSGQMPGNFTGFQGFGDVNPYF